jgi:hypothetical protein
MFEFFGWLFFFCCRSNLADLKKISTDIKCYWDKNKKEVGDSFHAKPLADFECVPKVKRPRMLKMLNHQFCINIGKKMNVHYKLILIIGICISV